MPMPDISNGGQPERLFVEISPRSAAPHASTAALTGVPCNGLGIFCRTRWEHLHQFGLHGSGKLHIFVHAAKGIAHPPDFTQFLVSKAFFLRLRQCLFFNQQALALITFARSAEFDYDRPQLAMLLG